MTVLRDPTGNTIQSTFKIPANRDADLVLDAAGVIQLKLEGGGGRAGGGESTVGPVIDGLLGP